MKLILNIDVPELEPAIGFYTKALGLEHSRTLDDDTAELTGGSTVIYLLKKGPGTPATGAASIDREYSRHWTPIHFDVVVPDVDAAASRAFAAGARQETGHIDWHGSRCMSFSDPFGHGFCFLQFDQDGSYTD